MCRGYTSAPWGVKITATKIAAGRPQREVEERKQNRTKNMRFEQFRGRTQGLAGWGGVLKGDYGICTYVCTQYTNVCVGYFFLIVVLTTIIAIVNHQRCARYNQRKKPWYNPWARGLASVLGGCACACACF